MNKMEKQTQIHIARISMGLEQKELADKINGMTPATVFVTPNMLSKIESGWKKTINRHVADALCKCLNITEAELTKKGIRING